MHKDSPGEKQIQHAAVNNSTSKVNTGFLSWKATGLQHHTALAVKFVQCTQIPWKNQRHSWMTYRNLLHSLLLIHLYEREKQNCYETSHSTHWKVWAEKSLQTFKPSELLFSWTSHKTHLFLLLEFMGQHSFFKIWRPKNCKGADWWAGTALPQDKLKRLASSAVYPAPSVQMFKLLVNQLPDHCSLQGRLSLEPSPILVCLQMLHCKT